ncbi:MAG TPA: hypothetical protein H9667_04595 [Firmicutes bacterium]|nr:hypothetical protein [Bacillota bacterium]
MAFVRRKRLPDGTLGELEKVSENSLTNEERLEKENKMLKAQISALTEQQDFTNDLIAELATKVYQ